MANQSAGILLYRFKHKELEVFLVHPGGPFFAKKDEGAWTIPKGEFDRDEEPLACAQREFTEETGRILTGTFLPLQPVRQKSGKLVWAWANEGDIDETTLVSNTFEMEWPPRSGKKKTFPEIDRGEWFNLQTALQKILPAQSAFLSELAGIINTAS